ncbi:hypothetical protein [Amaricoccus macauensis]|uniref:hypothetical protein n=1 Tax=Amaricoccus macauensis TaxID=57001 RepID=UPI003C7BE114
MIRALLSVLLLAALAPVETRALDATRAGVLSGEEFEEFAEGQTLRFEQNGRFFGAEQFFSGRRSLWQYSDGTCEYGQWYEANGLICFTYESSPDPQCWRVLQYGNGLAVQLFMNGTPTGSVATLTSRDSDPLPCPGPRVGS